MKSRLEKVLIEEYKEGMLDYVNSSPEAFIEAIELAIDNKKRLSWRAAWIVNSTMQENDKRVQKYTNAIIKSLEGKTAGHQRELLKILILLELDEECEGHMFEQCIKIWETVNTTPSVRYHAFRFLLQIAKKYPELIDELKFYAQSRYLDSLTPGIKSGLIKIMKEVGVIATK
jgi:hypothetical protein